MTRSVSFLLTALMMGCGPHEKRQMTNLPIVDALAPDPTHPNALRHQCRSERAKQGEALSNRIAETTRNRLNGVDPPTQYSLQIFSEFS